MAKLKSLNAKNNALMDSLNSSPLYSYFKYKIYYLNKSFKSISSDDLVKLAITQLSEEKLKVNLVDYRYLSLKDFLIYCKNVDLTQL